PAAAPAVASRGDVAGRSRRTGPVCRLQVAAGTVATAEVPGDAGLTGAGGWRSRRVGVEGARAAGRSRGRLRCLRRAARVAGGRVGHERAAGVARTDRTRR